MSAAERELLCFNGIDGATGEYLLPRLSIDQVAGLAQGERIDPDELRRLRHKDEQANLEAFGPAAGIDVANLAETGWGVIFPHNSPPEIRQALLPLLELRREQASSGNETFYQEFTGQRGLRPNEALRDFLFRCGVDPSQPADPMYGVPYYLLLVASPEEVPYLFQYQLDVTYSVGRLWFDTVDQFAQYAQSVVAAEKRQVRVARQAVFFGVQNDDDPATQLSATELVGPLADRVQQKLAQDGQPAWEITKVIGRETTKSRLAEYLGGPKTPALLFTASHGMGFPRGDSRQFRHQGALLTQDWPGPRKWHGAIPADHYFSADDVADGAQLQGLIAFHFACYGAGTPRWDDFAHRSLSGQWPEIAPHAFVASLPQQLLGHPRGGALAVVGHVERAWGYSFFWSQIGRQLQTFEGALFQAMSGLPVGAGAEFFNQRYAALATQLSSELEEIKFGRQPDNAFLAGTWTAHNDARSYVIVGDPAVRLPLVNGDGPPVRPAAARVSVPNLSTGRPARDTAAPRTTATAGGRPTTPPSPTPGSAPSQPRLQPEPPPGVTPFSGQSGEATDASAAFLAQIAATESRYRQAQSQPQSFETLSHASPIQRRNDPARIRRRLERLGVPAAAIEDVLSLGTSFRAVEASAAVTDGDEAREAPDDRWLERILGRNDLVDTPRFLEHGLRAARAVARIRVRSASGVLRGWGTGSLISPRLLLTNHHVLQNEAAAASSLAEFNYQDDGTGGTLAPVVFKLLPTEFFLSSAALDFTLVAVAERSQDGQQPLADFGYNAAAQGDDPILVEESVNIVQHPAGRPKQAALRDNQVTELFPDFVQYRTDTEPGSSGSPVFNDQWQLVALHHSGVPERDAQGRILARDGSLWQTAQGDQQIHWIANEGVRLSRILDFVRQATLANPTADALRRQLLSLSTHEGANATPPRPVVVPPSAGPTLVPAISTGNASDATMANNAVTVTIPLQITVSLGSIPGPLVAVPTSPALGSAPPPLEAISIDPQYGNREGYDPEFLGTGTLRVPLPILSPGQRQQASRLLEVPAGADQYELKYHHYSVVMNGARRLAFFTAVNIDGKKARDIARENDRWFFDPRIDRGQQVGNDLYASNPFDRGHLVRRLDPAWGRTEYIAKTANDDTFHFTNCSPQHERFNQGQNLWQGLENFLLDRATGAQQKLTIFTGPVFRADDPDYRGVQIPLEYWKVAVLADAAGNPAVLGFIVSQESLVRPVVAEAAIDTARTFQTSLAEVETLTGLDFGHLRQYDVQSVDSFAPQEGAAPTPRRELSSLSEIQLQGTNARAFEGASFSGDAASPAAGAGNGNPKEPVPGTDLSYYLLAFDEQSREREHHDHGKISAQILQSLQAEPITDVFLFSHGWRGDVPSAREQYQGWLRAMAQVPADRQRMRNQRPGFRPLLVGVHWPSEPWGDETLAPAAASFEVAHAADPVEAVVADFSQRLGLDPAAVPDLRQIVAAWLSGQQPARLPAELQDAYRRLSQALQLSAQGVAAAPGTDCEEFDPAAIYAAALREEPPVEAASFSIGWRDALLTPLRVLSYWKMKDRARHVGESGINPLLRSWQQAIAGRDVHFHVAGHSFGCVVASAAVAGAPGGAPLPQQIHSLVLLQGALSLWSYCSSIPYAPETPGYFRRIVAQHLVRGPIVTTQSRFDKAVGIWYPRASQVNGAFEFAAMGTLLPKYGAVGSFGLQGPGLEIEDRPMLSATADYQLQPQRIYNLESSQHINVGNGISGAHSDIRKPAVAHAVWSAAWTG